MKLHYVLPALALLTAPAAAQVYVPPGVEVPLTTTTEISSKTVKKGDKITFLVSADVMYAGHVVIPKGTTAIGVVTEAKKAGRFGSNGKLEIALNPISTVNGGQIALMSYEGDAAELSGDPQARVQPAAEPQKGGGGVEAGAVGSIVKGVGGFMNQGENMVIAANSKFPAFTAAYVPVNVDGATGIILGDDPGAPKVVTAALLAGKVKKKEVVRVSAAGTQTDSVTVNQPAADSAASTASAKDSSASTPTPASGDSAAVTSDSASSEPPMSMSPAEAGFYEATLTWHSAVAAFLAHQGSTPQVRSYGKQVVKENVELQQEGRAVAKQLGVEVAPVIPDEQTRLNELIKTLLGKPADAERDAQALQYMYQLEQAFLTETEGLDGPTPMGRLIAHATPKWKRYMEQTSKLMTAKPAAPQR